VKRDAEDEFTRHKRIGLHRTRGLGLMQKQKFFADKTGSTNVVDGMDDMVACDVHERLGFGDIE